MSAHRKGTYGARIKNQQRRSFCSAEQFAHDDCCVFEKQNWAGFRVFGSWGNSL
jgi:hypothetical protein